MCADQSSPFVLEGLESVTTLGSALRGCKPELLLDVLLDTEAGWGISYRDIGLTAKESLLEKLSSTLALMGSFDQKNPAASGTHGSSAFADQEHGLPCRQPDQKMIVPCETFEIAPDGRAFVRRLNARILDCSKLKTAMDVIQKTGGKLRLIGYEDPSAPFGDQITPYEAALETGLLDSIDALEDEPWSVALQRKIWLPRTYCERERYCILANVFWVMTYNGFFGDAAERLLGKPVVVSRPLSSFEDFDDDYKKRMIQLESLMNYNGWVDSIESLVCLCEAA